LKYQHLFFDLDHTLWDFDTNAKECLVEIYNEFDLKSKSIESFDKFFDTYEVHNNMLWGRYEHGYISSEELKWKRMWLTLLDFKIADEKLSREMGDYYLEILPRKSKVYDYTFEILNYLTGKGYALHLLTNGFDKTQRGKLASSKLDGYFRNIITSEVANSTKPLKEMFDFALKQTGGLAENSIMLGDNLETDIAGALNIGMDCVFVNHAHKNINPHSTYMVSHFKELEKIL
jgi:putative hydrolase of the HAD superfamily